ncbi:MAG: SoxR reducing system RseC family protein [bacterium]
MPRIGIIVETTGGQAVIETSRRGVCAECGHKSSCSLEGALGKDVPEKVRANNPIGAKRGDVVEFDLPGHTELKLSLLIWAVPLAGLIIGAITGANLYESFSLSPDVAAFIFGIAGLIIFFAPVMAYDRYFGRDHRLTPDILRITRDTCDHVS